MKLQSKVVIATANCHCQSTAMSYVFVFPKYLSIICNLTKDHYYLIFNNNRKEGHKFVNV